MAKMRIKRKLTNRKKDAKIFHKTALTTKAVNLTPKISRGGDRF